MSLSRFSQQYDRNKFVAVMQILATKVGDLDILKSAKLLYFIDRHHLRKFGKPILCDTYISMEFGPVPSESYNILKSILDGKNPFLPIQPTPVSTRKHPVFSTLTEPNTDFLSQREVESIEEIIASKGQLHVGALIDETHQHSAWVNCEQNGKMDYELFFAEEPEKCKNAYEAMLLEQLSDD
jgi:uncharacterized phage-associated protein